MSEVQAVLEEAWNEFTATSPEGIDYVAEASVLINGRSHSARRSKRRSRQKRAPGERAEGL